MFEKCLFNDIIMPGCWGCSNIFHRSANANKPGISELLIVVKNIACLKAHDYGGIIVFLYDQDYTLHKTNNNKRTCTWNGVFCT